MKKINQGILKNFSYLSLIHVFNAVMPLLILPYLIKVLGKDLYGLVAFVQAIVLYIGLVVNFGFYASATKSVAQNQNNPRMLSEVVSSVYILKTIICIIVFVIYVFIVLVIPYSREYFLLFFFSFGLTFQDLLLPVWYFQGLEKMKYITITNLISRLVLLLLIFLFVKKKSDYLLVPLLNTIGVILGAIFSMYVIFKNDKIKFVKVPISALQQYFKDSVPLFISSLSISLYVNAGKILVGSFLNMSDVAVYDVIEKVTRMLRIPITTFGQAVFPRMVKSPNINEANRFTIIALLISVVLLGATTLFANEIIYYFLKMKSFEINKAMFIANISILFVALSYFWGTNRLVALGYNIAFSKNVVISGGIYFIYIGILYITNNISLTSISSALLFVECITAILMGYKCYRLSILK